MIAWQHNRGSDITLGKRLPAILREAGFTNTVKSISADTKGKPEDVHSHAEITVSLLDDPFGRDIVDNGWADKPTVEHLKESIRAWAEHPDAFFANVHVEVIGLADVVLPVASAFEREALKVGFEVSAEAQSLVQLRQRVVDARGEARSDTEIVFDLAGRLGLGAHFWDGDVEAAYRYQLGPSGVTLEALRDQPGGVSVAEPARYRKFAEQEDGVPRGFNTPTRKIEQYSERMLKHGYPPLPEYEAPLVSPSSRPALAERFPLILTCAKHTLFCESQHRALPSLRRRAMDPEVELHPAAAAERGIAAGDWVYIETPEGRVRARARLNDTLQPDVVCGQHGWWQPCPELDAPGYDAFDSDGANFNLIIGNEAIDPISGSVPHRAYVCQVRPVD